MLSEPLYQAMGADEQGEKPVMIQLKLGSWWQRLDWQSQPIDFQSDAEIQGFSLASVFCLCGERPP